jgi:RimJ/RimL family protein N-acetyltransferase
MSQSDATTGPASARVMDPARLEFVPVAAEDLETLVAWLTTDTWPFHGRTRPTAEQVQAAAAEGAYWGDENRTFWVIVDEASRVGLIRLEDLQDHSPTTDFRVRTPYRGRGIGTEMVRFAADHLFTAFPDKPRLEGQTRVDNLGMRRTFRRAGWIPEAFYRKAWPAEDGTVYDAVGYAILRDDWANGTTTPVPWPIE